MKRYLTLAVATVALSAATLSAQSALTSAAGWKQRVDASTEASDPDPAGDVGVGRRQKPGAVEVPQHPGGVERGVPVVLASHGVDGHEPASRPPKWSETASTNAWVGFHAKTPYGCPSATGVPAPHMPRR